MTNDKQTPQFDAQAKERALAQESQSWDTSTVHPARDGDIPVIDISEYLSTPNRKASARLVAQLGEACRYVGFYSLVGHSIGAATIANGFAQTKRFHEQPLERKQALQMDTPGSTIPGAGYLPVKHRKLPRRETGNENEAFIIKRDLNVALEDNPWPAETNLAGFQHEMMALATQFEALALSLLPLYAQALGMPGTFFADGFKNPLYRLRLTHYPAAPELKDAFGIAPHVDTTFITLLAQDSPGLCVFSERRRCWIAVPKLDGALIVNTGELLKQWSNDEFISVKHFANNTARQTSRYSIPFFFNATADYPMACIPTCCGPDRPAKYATISYNESQGVIQGE